MSKFKDMIIEIEEMLASGEYTFDQIANFFGIPVESVAALAKFNFSEDELV